MAAEKGSSSPAWMSFPLHHFSIGVWTTRKPQKCLLLLKKEAKKYVIVVYQDKEGKDLGRIAALQRTVTQTVSHMVDRSNPLRIPSDMDKDTAVLAFEVPWEACLGLDYRWPLVIEGRLVIETKIITKLTFRCMADMCAYYDWQPPKRRQARTPQAARRLAAGSSSMSLQELAMQHELGRLRTRTTAGGALSHAPSASDLSQHHACTISAWQQSGRHAQRHSMAEIPFDPASAVLPSAKHARSTPTSPRTTSPERYYPAAPTSDTTTFANKAMHHKQHQQHARSHCHAQHDRHGQLSHSCGDLSSTIRNASVERRGHSRAQLQHAAALSSRSEPLGAPAAGQAGAAPRGCPPASTSPAESVTFLDTDADTFSRRTSLDSLDQLGDAGSSPGAYLSSETCPHCLGCARAAAGPASSAALPSQPGSPTITITRSRGQSTSAGGAGAPLQRSSSGRSHSQSAPASPVASRRRLQQPRNEFSAALDASRLTVELAAAQLATAAAPSDISSKRSTGGGSTGATAGSDHNASGPGTSPAQQQGQQQAGSAAAEPASRCSYKFRTLTLTFTDPHLPLHLGECITADMRMLKLYESGLPAWAVFLPSYGLWYRPWMRQTTWLLFVLVSAFSMACGFYDLYKNVPHFKQVVAGMAARLYLPGYAIFEWLEEHTQVRLSILLTYLFGKSDLFTSLIKLLSSTAACLHNLAQPALEAAELAGRQVALVLGPAMQAAKLLGVQLAEASVAMASGLHWLAVMLLGPPARMVWVLVTSLGDLLGSLAAVLWAPLQLVYMLLCQLASVGKTAMATGRAAGNAASTAAPLVAGAGRHGWYYWYYWHVEALELMRNTAVRVLRALQAVLRAFMHVGVVINQHRLSLLMQLRQTGEQAGGRVARTPAWKVAQFVARPVTKMIKAQAALQLQQGAADATPQGFSAESSFAEDEIEAWQQQQRQAEEYHALLQQLAAREVGQHAELGPGGSMGLQRGHGPWQAQLNSALDAQLGVEQQEGGEQQRQHPVQLRAHACTADMQQDPAQWPFQQQQQQQQQSPQQQQQQQQEEELLLLEPLPSLAQGLGEVPAPAGSVTGEAASAVLQQQEQQWDAAAVRIAGNTEAQQHMASPDLAAGAAREASSTAAAAVPAQQEQEAPEPVGEPVLAIVRSRQKQQGQAHRQQQQQQQQQQGQAQLLRVGGGGD